MNRILYLLLIIMTLMGAFAGFFLKKASANLELSIKKILKNKYLYVGGILYLLSAFLNIYILSYMDYSIVLPLTSVTYIWTMIISKFMLNEKITKLKIGGVCAIIIGVLLMI